MGLFLAGMVPQYSGLVMRSIPNLEILEWGWLLGERAKWREVLLCPVSGGFP
jgi:hypothetical protein